MHVTIIGMGEIGSALYHLLHARTDILLHAWDKNNSKHTEQNSLEHSLTNSEIIFICVPSWNLRSALLNITPHLKTGALLVTLTKGVEKESRKTADAILTELLPNHAFGILGGPMIAEDLMSDKPTQGILATTSNTLRQKVKKLFQGTTLNLTTTTDVHGAVICSVLKNIYTLSLGIATGLDLGDNAQGAVFTHALHEMQFIMRKLGGRASTVTGLVGLGDFYATSLSSHSRNRLVGMTLGAGGDGYLESEGFMSLAWAEQLTANYLDDLPLLQLVIQIAHRRRPPEALREFILS